MVLIQRKQFKLLNTLGYATLLFMAIACGTTTQIPTTDILQTEMQAENYQSVYDKATALIQKNESKGKENSDVLLQMAGEAAFKLEKKEEAKKYLTEAIYANPQNEEAYPTLAQVYRNMDNLSYEVTTYEKYFKAFGDSGLQNQAMQKQFFDAYVRSENWEPANVLWQKLPDDRLSNENLLLGYLQVTDKLDLEEEKANTVESILKLNPQNKTALLAKAFALYNRAETRYNEEMAAYNKNKTRKQYTALLKALDVSSEEFKLARDIYEPIYKEDPTPEIARYLSNIYARLNNKEKAEYYKKTIQ